MSSDETHGQNTTVAERTEPTPAEELLELLGDEYTRQILDVLIEQPRSCREIVEAADVSRATVYRRIEQLQTAGFVEVSQKLDPDGHHCKQFSLVVEQFDFEIGQDGFSVTVRTEPGNSSPVHRGNHQAGHAGADD